MKYSTPFFVVSVTNPDGQHDKHALEWLLENVADSYPISGRWEGKGELGAIVFNATPGPHDEAFALMTGIALGQKAVLMVDSNRAAVLLHTATGELEEVPGRWQEAVGEIGSDENFTKTHDGKVWVVR